MLINQLREITGIQDPETLCKALNVRTQTAADGLSVPPWPLDTVSNHHFVAHKHTYPNTHVSESTKMVCRVSDYIGFAVHFTVIKLSPKGNMMLHRSDNENMFTGPEVPAALCQPSVANQGLL